ncbi:MAG: response regulator [Phenylobacterium sp.]|uniref:response regulator n=1 Tax=Phenylobacterium sp. TaxID=1871053 RepID=UPI002733BA92|nr:response regulator [Phenylobacterium sp.]MDP3175115.1 response regulator [Phenylobacterium sp.]
MRILIVEDDALIALDIAWLLQDLGHEVCAEAADAFTGLEAAEQTKPDMAVIDIRLARNTDGGKLARTLYCRLGVRSLFVSGSITEAFRNDMAGIEPLGFLAKPVTRRHLDAALRGVAA